MEINYNNVGKANTAKNYMDFLRPAAMANAPAIFKKLQLVNGSDAFDAVSIASEVAAQITTTKGSEIDQVWSKIEKRLYRRKPLKTIATTPIGKLNTALGLLYSAMEVVDTGDNINFVRDINSLYRQAKSHVESRFLGRQEGFDKRTLQRTLDTMDSFFDRVIKRFNERVKNLEIQGHEIEV